MKRFRSGFLFLLICLLLSFAFAEGSGTLVLPSDTHWIEDEAFMGLESVEEIVLPDKVFEIGARAFANSSIKRINLPQNVYQIGEDAFANCDSLTVTVYESSYAYYYCAANHIPYVVLAKPTPTPTPAPTPEPTPEPEVTVTPGGVQTIPPEGEAVVYINNDVLYALGLTAPSTMDELFIAVDAASMLDRLGMVSEEYAHMAAVFRRFDPSFTADDLYRLVAQGTISNIGQADRPFSSGALFVVTDDPLAVDSPYVSFVPGTAPMPTPSTAPTPTATPMPTDGLTAYVRQDWLDSFGLETPGSVDEMLSAMNAAADCGMYGLAAQSYTDFISLFRTVDASFDQRQLDLLIAAGELWSFIETEDPFNAGALFVVSKSADFGDYQVFVPGAAPVPTPTPTPKPTPRPLDGLTAYVSEEWLANLGLEAPGSVNELIYAVEAVGDFGLCGMAAQNYQDYLAAFQAVDSTFDSDKLTLLLAAGEMSNWVETTEPFRTGALFVISDSLPDEYADDYTVFVAGLNPKPTPTPTPKPTYKPADGLIAYVNETWLANLGLEPPAGVNDILSAMNSAGDFDVCGIAAKDVQDFVAVFRVVEPTFEAEKIDLLLASAELWNWTVNDDPFLTDALFVVSDSLPDVYAGDYAVFTARPISPTPTPHPTANPSAGRTVYANQDLMAELGLVPPSTVDELLAAIKFTEQQDHTTLAAESYDQFLSVFRAVDPAFEAEKVMLMIAAGQLTGWEETDDPFSTFALFVVSDSPPNVYKGSYILFAP